MLEPAIISEVNRSPRAIFCASNLAFDTSLTTLRTRVWVMNFQSHTSLPSLGSQGIQGQYIQGWLHMPLGHNWRRMLNPFLNKQERRPWHRASSDSTAITSAQLSALHPFVALFFLPDEGEKRKAKRQTSAGLST